MRLSKLISIVFVSAMTAATTAGCGDDDGSSADAGARIDSGGDIDASAAPFYRAQILFGDFSLIDLPAAGEGPLIQIAFRPNDQIVAPSFEQQPGSPFGCKVFELTAEQYAYGGLDEGTVQITADGGPAIPPCAYDTAKGAYRCVATTGSGGAIAVIDAGMGLYSWTDPDTTFTNDEIGRYLDLSGATPMANNGHFPIVARPGPNTLIYKNAAGVAEADSAASFETVAGTGPAGQTDTISDDGEVTVELTSGGEGHYEDLTATFPAPVAIGDHFTLDDASAATITAIPLDGSEFSIGCGGAGGECNTATVSAINIFTTDAPVPPPPAPEVVFPNPVTSSIQIQCISINTDQVVVTADAAAYLDNADITRVRTSFVRAQNAAVMNEGDVDASISVVTGHIQTGFTTVE